MANPNASAAPLPRILLVDDYVEIRDLLVTLFRRAGFEVDAVGDGAAAWDTFCSREYDLLITDNDMPVLTGLEFVRKIRSIPSEVPVIVISGFALPDERDALDLVQPGAFISKPFAFPVLQAKVAELMNGRMPGTNGGAPVDPHVFPLQPEHGMDRSGVAARDPDFVVPPFAEEDDTTMV